MLMRAALAGDGIAYRELLDTLSRVLRGAAHRGFARAGLGPDEAEDVVQETLLAIHLKRHTWDPDKPLGPWVRAVARHKLLDALKRRGRRIEIPVDDLIDVLPAEPAETGLDRRDVDRMLEQLGGRQREIVRSVSVEGVSIRDTAERLNMTDGAVRVALHRGLRTLAALYKRVAS